ncbi:hypothetical protein SISSUDRAFT_1059542 [Sistotremastrum suecicum HHB10207 ss-3]|uniref:Alpha/beta-hydrolase n=1 Tax=Sistotremastrum suecicum HHB10207 ss-3 TaxID=1314776 RepID=A0A166G855_9AGAM|nr:hypothetical protein SISSUDRAFT_1059542 [Sistotremastrum suecicum HHB10207 ss-3]
MASSTHPKLARSKSTASGKGLPQSSSPPSLSFDSFQNHHHSHSRAPTDPHPQDFTSTLDFPVVPDYSSSLSHKKSRSRSRPSTKTPSLRDSGSSSTHPLITPPETPRSRPAVQVVVSAPISGVETMDALVDGMNGVDGDDLFMMASLRKREKKQSMKSKPPSPHHPLYHPPLPTPPPGVTLAPASVPRSKSTRRSRIPRPVKSPKQSLDYSPPSEFPLSSSSNTIVNQPSTQRSYKDEPEFNEPYEPELKSDDPTPESTLRIVTPPERPPQPYSPPLSIDEIIRKHATNPPKTVIPSISEIIRTHAPSQARKFPSKALAIPPSESEREDWVSRSSVDSIAEEIRHTLNQPLPKTLLTESGRSASPSLQSTSHGTSTYSGTSSVPPSPARPYGFAPGPVSQTQAIATYLRSTRLTTLIQLTRHPHKPMQVSISDLGDPNGRPLIVFLGLGSVRYLMGLYDEMAECLGLRLITIDRWGLGRTTSVADSARGVKEWASVVTDVLDRLGIEQCSVMAHSAGAPYAMAFANLRPERIQGDVCLLAPWVGGGEGANYKWLKYVPNGLLKTAHAAEWKLQTWMIGKPPTIAYQGIGFDPRAPISSPATSHAFPSMASPCFDQVREERKSQESGLSKEYDDLADFDGRFESRSTIVNPEFQSVTSRELPPDQQQVGKRRSSRSFLPNFLRSPTTKSSKDPIASPQPTNGKKLKNLRSMSSLRGGASSTKSTVSPRNARTSTQSTPVIPAPHDIGVGLGFARVDWEKLGQSTPQTPAEHIKAAAVSGNSPSGAPNGRSRRSVSFTARTAPTGTIQPMRSVTTGASTAGLPSRANSITSSTAERPSTSSNPVSYQASLGNALIAASHAESAKGTHSDLLTILNHDRKPWGFSYNTYPHAVKVWYGDKDERIAEGAVRWMEKNMKAGMCEVKVVKGADHGLMYKSGVVVEVLETVRAFWS